MSPARSLRNRVTYANVASTLALALVAGGGTAYAAGLVDTADIKRGAVTTPKIAKNAVTSKKVQNGSILRADLRPGVSGYEDVVLRSTTFSFQVAPGSTGQYQDATAQCQAGEDVLSGGHQVSPNASSGGAPNVVVVADRPAVGNEGDTPTAGATPDGWYVHARRESGTVAHTVTVWVVCGS